MQRWGKLVVVGLSLSGCKYLDKGKDDRRPDGTTSGEGAASRTRDRARDGTATSGGGGGGHWLDGPASRTPRNDLPPAPAGRVGVPPADSWADPRDPNFDVRTEVKGTLSGYVEDPWGQKLRGVFIEVRAVGEGGGGAPVGVETGEQGYFLIKGLKPAQSYQLTAKTQRDGTAMAGQVFAKPPNVYVRLPLIDGLKLPESGGPAAPASRPEGGGVIPPPVLPSGATEARPGPIPLSQERPRNVDLPGSDADSARERPWSPVGPAGLPPAGPARPEPPRTDLPGRADLVAPGPVPEWKPTPANIPPPTGPATFIPPPADIPGRTQQRVVRKPDFVLVDTPGRVRGFPSGNARELVLLDFMTTTCVPCKKAVPALKQLQERYGARGLEVVGVACDEVDPPQRRAFAAKYQRDYGLNYLLYIEPDREPGKVRERFNVEYYPTLVLLNGSGEVVWKGNSQQVAQLEQVIAAQLSK